ncbi:MAG: ribosome-associated translation inhibitor RaiA [Candidatus Faecisoma sp.]|nr:ribosome-associated translation inhibitor RaiA [Acholeplasma sp.]MCI5677680.1 ribosome-associated translation inhibitor RaiA [Acholeplasma sp.]MDY2892272.1 ribosome-associated translation inhibitor RaiA [Candidatus Faecisoma sp.]
MKINARGQKIKVTDAIQAHAEEKLKKLDKYFDTPEEITANVLIKVKGKDQTVEVTIPTKKFILRGEETNNDLYAAIDLVTDKLERQIRKNKTRLKKKNVQNVIDFKIDFEVEKEDENKSKIVKRKNIEMKPMSEEEAILQLELLGHSFFVFKNVKTDEIDILYRRNDGDYGIIETR